LQYSIIDANSGKKFKAAVKQQCDESFINKKYIKSFKRLKVLHLILTLIITLKKYGNEIKSILKSLPE